MNLVKINYLQGILTARPFQEHLPTAEKLKPRAGIDDKVRRAGNIFSKINSAGK